MRFSVRRQLTVPLLNEPGQLGVVCQLLADYAINIDALAVVDNVSEGAIRILPSNGALARQVLEESGYHVVEADVLEIGLRHRPGELARLATAMAGRGINIDYAYGTEGSGGDGLSIVLRVADPVGAARALQQPED